MYKRDFGILLLSIFAIYYTLQQEGTFHFHKAWYFHLHEHEYLPHSDSDLPTAVVADLNGDGAPEVIVATHDAQIKVLSPKRASRAGGGGFAAASVMATIELAPPGVRNKEGWEPVVMEAGYIDPQPKELVKALRKMVFVVLTANLHVMVFDHNLKMMWTKYLKGSMPDYSSIHEAAIHITPHRVQKGDRGLVVVGYSLRLGDHGDEASGGALEEEERYEHSHESGDEEQDGGAANKEEGELKEFDSDAKDVSHGVDLSRHFSYYAYEGERGTLRWDHEGADFHRDLDTLSDTLTPQHHYRLTAEEMQGRHFGEVSCRDYRESILAATPHRWTRRSDTSFDMLHFVKHKTGKGAQKSRLAGGGKKADPRNAGRTLQKSEEGTNPVASAVGKVAKIAVSGSSRADHSAAHPNALVTHLMEGMEAIHLFTGRTICKLHLPSPGLHVDLNGDGVLDHITAYGGHAPRHDVEVAHHRMGSCRAIATSGIPPREPLFNGSICSPRDIFGFHGTDEEAFIEVAAPVMLPTYRSKSGGRLGGLAVFLNSKGDVTAFTAHGQKLWQVNLGPMVEGLGPHRGAHGESEDPHMTLEALSLRSGGLPSTVLVAGETKAVVLSEHGHILDEIYMPLPPTAPLQIVDFNGDGLHDIILFSQGGWFGYMQVRHPGGTPFGALIGTLIVVMVLVYVTQQGPARRGRKKGRSTDRTD